MSDSTLVVYDDVLSSYDFGRSHPMRPVRLELTMELARQTGVLARPGVQVQAPSTAGDDVLELVHGAHGVPADPLADAGRGGVEQADELEPAGAEAGVVRQRGTEVPDADQHAGPGPLHTEHAGDAVAQGADLVADAADAAGAEVGEVLAEPGGVDPGRRGQFTGCHGAPAAVGQSGQHPEVDGQAGDGGLRDRPGPRLDHGLSTAVAPECSERGDRGTQA